MFYRILADSVVLIHFLWILFIVFGAVGGRKNKTIKLIHVSGLAFAFIIEVFNWYCPLTYLEAWFRSMHDPSLSYTGSFIIHYVERLIYIDLSRSLVSALTILLCLFNGWLYLGTKRSK